METEKTGPDTSVETNHSAGNIRVFQKPTTTSESVMVPSRASEPFVKRLIRWLCPDQRVANRHTMPPLVSYLGTVRSSRSEYKIGDVSVAGFFMITEERWIPGTSFPITLERTDEPGRTLTVKATVVREAEDGVGFSFLPSPEESANNENESAARIDLTKIAQFLKGLPLIQATAEELERAS